MTLAAQHCDYQLGAPQSEIILKGLNVGLTRDHLRGDNPFAYTFTRALVHDLREIFGPQQAQGLFLCELGSQKRDQVIDMHFKERCDAQAEGTYPTPTSQEDCAFCDRSYSLKEYLQQALQAAKLNHLQVLSAPPYAYIGDTQKHSVSPPERFTTVPGNTHRHGVRYNVEYLPTGDKFPVICNHSPSSGNWDKLTVQKKQTVFDCCMRQALTHPRHASTHAAQPPMWMICGDLNTTRGTLLAWKGAYENANDSK